MLPAHTAAAGVIDVGCVGACMIVVVVVAAELVQVPLLAVTEIVPLAVPEVGAKVAPEPVVGVQPVPVTDHA